MRHILEPDSANLQAWLADRGQPTYRARQVEKWLFTRRATSFEPMSDLPRSLREALTAEFAIWTSRVSKIVRSADGTEKLLLQLDRGGSVECVLLRDGARRSICLSSQVGCGMGCRFCASGLGGFQRNLTSGEMIEQMLWLQTRLPADERLTHVVMMGMGEPLANLQNVLAALDRASSPSGLGISPRRITISTVGLPAAIDRLAKRQPRYHLAVSLHAPNDRLRNELAPVNQQYGLRRILEAADGYFEVSGRRLTFEYVLLGGINDRPEQARQLAALLRGRPMLLNVIPYNPVPDLPYREPSRAAILRFQQILEEQGLVVHRRRRKGADIAAACGQLQRSSTSPVSF